MREQRFQFVGTVEELQEIYGKPGKAALIKVSDRLTPLYRRWIMTSRLVMVSTVGPEGTDGSPRGDVGPVVKELDPRTLLLPDWRGNNRIDTLQNIVRDGRISLMFIVPGSNNVVRVNGRAGVTLDESLINLFQQQKNRPRSVVVIQIQEIYTQCAGALMRSELWEQAKLNSVAATLPTVGDILSEMSAGDFDGEVYPG